MGLMKPLNFRGRAGRFVVLALLASGTLLTGVLATASCCEGFNVLAMLRDQPTTCMGFSPHRPYFMGASLLLLGATLGYCLYGPGASQEPGIFTAAGLTALAMSSGLFLFVVS